MKINVIITKGIVCPAFKQKGGGQRVLHLLFLSCLQLKILMPKWHILWWYILIPFMYLPFIFLKDFIYLFLDRGEGREKERERNIIVCSLECPLLGTWPATQACALTGNQPETLGLQAGAQSTEPHQPGPYTYSLNVRIHQSLSLPSHFLSHPFPL